MDSSYCKILKDLNIAEGSWSIVNGVKWVYENGQWVNKGKANLPEGEPVEVDPRGVI